ncbi:hypothetical protein Micbo1qcDRAFT_179789 [Microdochium bolleyi]|uniref:Uncharacterized protein n=1 Tax=Microdochium bolleyi TaxID=196109 RepID=A0A136INT5_9PEZI|nr:hypothetical protein Micbo1qcDRAFT_179789 [Microdochium bolleyi]
MQQALDRRLLSNYAATDPNLSGTWHVVVGHHQVPAMDIQEDRVHEPRIPWIASRVRQSFTIEASTCSVENLLESWCHAVIFGTGCLRSIARLENGACHPRVEESKSFPHIRRACRALLAEETMQHLHPSCDGCVVAMMQQQMKKSVLVHDAAP